MSSSEVGGGGFFWIFSIVAGVFAGVAGSCVTGEGWVFSFKMERRVGGFEMEEDFLMGLG